MQRNRHLEEGSSELKMKVVRGGYGTIKEYPIKGDSFEH